MNQLTASRNETANRLNNLKAYMPDADETLSSFAAYLATRLSPEVTPVGFKIDCLLAVNHWPNGNYNELRQCVEANIHKVVDAIFPADFAEEMRAHQQRFDTFWEETQERGRKAKTEYLHIIPGVKVETTKPNTQRCNSIHEVVWGPRQWGVQGVVVARNDHAGLCFNVQHPDKTVGCYDPLELNLLESAT